MIMTNRKIGMMLHFCFVFSFLCVSILLATSIALAQEQVTITTYYPAPYGIYHELRTDGIAVGSAYRNNPVAGTIPDGTLVVSGKVGIGRTIPPYPLTVGSAAEGDAFSVAASGDIIVTGGSDNNWALYKPGGVSRIYIANTGNIALNPTAGNVGIGTAVPTTTLNVQGGSGAGGGRPATARFSSSGGGPGIVEVGEVWYCQTYS